MSLRQIARSIGKIALITLILLAATITGGAGESLDVTLAFESVQEDSTRVALAQRCNGNYGYQDIVNNISSEDMRLLYEAIDRAALAFWMSDADLPEDNLAYAEIDISSLSLDENQIVQVARTYSIDHPLYYWMSNGVSVTVSDSKTILSLWCYADYASGDRREQEYSRIVSAIAEYAEYCEGASKRYTYATAVLYLMAQKIDYAYNASGDAEEAPWAHSIVGVFNSSYGTAVCEGYADAYQLLMNYFGVPSVYVDGYANGNTDEAGERELHAWNLVQMDDDNWYWTDPTWSDVDMRISYGIYGIGDGYTPVEIEDINKLDDMYFRVCYTYHLKGDAFCGSHEAFTSDHLGAHYLYPLPTASAVAYVPDIAGEPAIEQPIIGDKNAYFVNFSSSYGVETYSDGPFEYAIIQNDGLHRRVAVAYGNWVMRQQDEITIPSTVSINGVEYEVVCVNLDAVEPNISRVVISEGVKWLLGSLNYEKMETESIYIPGSVEYVQLPYLSSSTLSEINVSADNPYIKSVDGVLYSKDGSVLMRYGNCGTEDYSV